jgi:hypothetical protein
MQRWYVQFKDQLIGPINEKEIVKNIKAGKIPSKSYLCREGDVEWYPATEISFCFHEFHGEQIDMDVELMPERQWVVLQLQDSGDYDQDGPYATREILSKIAKGDLDYSDRIWRPGMQSWERIGELSSFVPSAIFDEEKQVDIQPEPLLTKETSEDLLQSVAQLEGKDLLTYAKDMIPHEAEGEDLTQSRQFRKKEELSIDEINQMSFSFGHNKQADKIPSEDLRSRHIPKNYRLTNLISKIRENLGRVAAVGVLLLLVGFLLKHFIVIEPSTPANASEKKISEYKKAHLKIYGQALNSLRPKLEIRSNYKKETQLHLEIIGVESKILNHYRFHSSKSLTFLPGEKIEVNLADERLADGYYIVKAKLGNLKTQKEIFIGVNDIQFESRLKQFNIQKKKRSELEQKILQSVSEDLEKRTEELISTLERDKLSTMEWKSFYNSWKRKFYESAHTELRSFSGETRHKFVNVDDFAKLKNLRLDLWKTTKEIDPQKPQDFVSKVQDIKSNLQNIQ